MNAIEKDFLKVMLKHAYWTGGEEISATELSGKVERFTAWCIKDVFKHWKARKYALLDSNIKIKSIPELWQYYFTNVDNK